jgi:hypothetical protein
MIFVPTKQLDVLSLPTTGRLSRANLKPFNLRNQYRWGVVYAVRFSPDDLQWLADGGSEGVQGFGVIPPEKIAAKARVYNLTEEIAMRRKLAADTRLLKSGKFFSGLRSFLDKDRSSNQRMASPLNLFDRKRLDPSAGVDISPQIVARLKMNADGVPRNPKNAS